MPPARSDLANPPRAGFACDAQAHQSRIVLVFLDGVGVGPPGPDNPLDLATLPIFRCAVQGRVGAGLPLGGLSVAIDPSMGIGGLPQSATGQTALLAGVNAAALLGRHLEGFPNGRLRQVICERSIFKVLAEHGLPATFANAYRPEFFRVPFEAIVRRISVTTVAMKASGLRYRTLADLRRGEAVYHDVTNQGLAELGHEVAPIRPHDAGVNLARIASANRFTLYEHFLTDRAGHAQDRASAGDVLARLEALLGGLLAEVDPSSTTVLVTSDHGNIEDLSTPRHTTHPVPVFLWGEYAADLAPTLVSILDVYPAILRVLLAGVAPGMV